MLFLLEFSHYDIVTGFRFQDLKTLVLKRLHLDVVMMPIVYQFQCLGSFNCLLSVSCYEASLISNPFRRLHQANQIAEGKARPQHWEVCAPILFK